MGDLTAKIDKLKALEVGKGLQYLFNEGYAITGYPILAQDMEYKLIAITENIVIDDPIWNDYANFGVLSSDTIKFLKEEKFLDAAANAKKITFLPSKKLKLYRIFGKLLNCDNIQVGAACMIEYDKPFDDDVPAIFDCFCDVINREIARSEFYRVYGQEYQEILINQLIDGSIDDKGILTAHVESIYIGLKSHLYLAVTEIAPPAQFSLTHYRDLFKQTQPAFKYSIYDNRIVFIISSDAVVLDVKKELRRLYDVLGLNKASIGISSHFENLYELKKYYAQAIGVLRDGMEKDSWHRVFIYKSGDEAE